MTRLLTADASRTSGADFARSLGLRIRTKEQKAADWRADCERYADMIENGNEWGVPPPYLADARRIAEQRVFAGLVPDADKLSDPFRRVA